MIHRASSHFQPLFHLPLRFYSLCSYLSLLHIQDRKEREARAAEGGWTVVTHHKGRKKTTESETGTVVGSVSEAALRDQAAKKKQKEVGLDFYRFQKREAQRNGM